MRYVTYSEKEKNIVEKGLIEIQKILMGTDDDAKASLLFCLDKYLDPYYGYNLPYSHEIFDLLEAVVISPNSIDIREEALNLLISYAGGPFPIIEKHYDGLPEEIKSEAKYAVNMYTMWKCVELALQECLRIFAESKRDNDKTFNMGEFPQSAIVVYNTEGTEDGSGYDNIDTIEEVWEISGDKYKVRGIDYTGIPRVRTPISGAYYPRGEFYFNIDMIKKEMYLSYIFGPRYGRGLKYQIQIDEEKCEIVALINSKDLWVM